MRFFAPTCLALLCASTAQARNNHFLLELEGGVSAPAGVDAEAHSGGHFNGTLGVGGKIRGLSPAWYLVGRLGAGGFAFDGPARYGRAEVDKEQSEWAIGGRVYLPFHPRVRLMLQVAGGETFDSSVVSRDGHRSLLLETEIATLFTDAGLQLRFTENFSLGAVAGLSWFLEEDKAELASMAAGIDDGGPYGRARLGVTTTFHF